MMKRPDDVCLKVSPISKDEYRRHVIQRCVSRVRNNRDAYLAKLRQGHEDDLRACAQDLFVGELEQQEQERLHPSGRTMAVDDGPEEEEARGNSSQRYIMDETDDEAVLFTEDFFIQLMEEISSELGPSWHKQDDDSNSNQGKHGRARSAITDSPSTAASTFGDYADLDDDLDGFAFPDPGEELDFADDGQDDFLLCIFCRRCPMRHITSSASASSMEMETELAASSLSPASAISSRNCSSSYYECSLCSTSFSSASSLGLFEIRDRFADILWRHREHCTISDAVDCDLSLAFEPCFPSSSHVAAASSLSSPQASLKAICEVCMFQSEVHL